LAGFGLALDLGIFSTSDRIMVYFKSRNQMKS